MPPAVADAQRYWFRAKRYGWGWGLPCAWQGWVVLAAFVVLVTLAARFVLPRFGAVAFCITCMLLVLGLVCVTWLTGEAPRWRWGRDRK